MGRRTLEEPKGLSWPSDETFAACRAGPPARGLPLVEKVVDGGLLSLQGGVEWEEVASAGL